MIQRKQTIFLFLAAVMSVLALCFPLATVSADGFTLHRVYSLWMTTPSGALSYLPWPLFMVMLLAASLSVYTIFRYTQRTLQASFCLINIMLHVIWYVALAVLSKCLAPNAADFHVNIAAVFPAIAIILCFMARQGILSDERKVRAADRIR